MTPVQCTHVFNINRVFRVVFRFEAIHIYIKFEKKNPFPQECKQIEIQNKESKVILFLTQQSKPNTTLVTKNLF